MSEKGVSFFVGSYTEYPIPSFGGIGRGIYSVELNTKTGELSIRHTIKSRNPSYLTKNTNNRFLYAVSELDESSNPKVRSFTINDDSSLSFLNEQAIPGGYPCHIILKDNNVMVACYVTGNLLHYLTKTNGALTPRVGEFQHSGSSVNKERQEGPHAHQVAMHPNGKEVYVCDLGVDTIKGYKLEESVLVPNPAKDCKVSEGSGPRHLVFNKKGDYAYVINELTGTVAILEHKQDCFTAINDYNTLPEDFKGLPSSSAIRLHPNGKFLYTANRNLEAITIFKIEGDSLETINYQYTNGEELREFNISPDGKWLIACHQNSHDTVVYAIKNDGKLKEHYRTTEILSPVCVVF
ncbi:MAG: lactonase family protein [Maribacter sp.]